LNVQINILGYESRVLPDINLSRDILDGSRR